MEGDYQFFEYFENGIKTLSIQNPFASLEDLQNTTIGKTIVDRMYYPARISTLDSLVYDEKN